MMIKPKWLKKNREIEMKSIKLSLKEIEIYNHTCNYHMYLKPIIVTSTQTKDDEKWI